MLSSVNDLFNTSFCDIGSDSGIYVTVIAYSCDPKDFAKSRAYSAAFNEYSEPSIATRILEIFLFVKLNGRVCGQEISSYRW